MYNIVTRQFLTFWGDKNIFNFQISLVVQFSCILKYFKMDGFPFQIKRISTYSFWTKYFCIKDISVAN